MALSCQLMRALMFVVVKTRPRHQSRSFSMRGGEKEAEWNPFDSQKSPIIIEAIKRSRNWAHERMTEWFFMFGEQTMTFFLFSSSRGLIECLHSTLHKFTLTRSSELRSTQEKLREFRQFRYLIGEHANNAIISFVPNFFLISERQTF